MYLDRPVLRLATLLVDRRGPLVRTRTETASGARSRSTWRFDSMMAQLADPRDAPEMLAAGSRSAPGASTIISAPTAKRRRARRKSARTRPYSVTMARMWLPRCKPFARSETPLHWTRRSTMLSRAHRGGHQHPDGRFEALRQPGLLRPLPAPSCPTARCATCCGSPRCLHQAARAAGAERTGNQPASRLAAGAGPLDRGCRTAHAGFGGDPCRAA